MSQISHEPDHAPSQDESFARLAQPLAVPERRPSSAWQGWAFFGGAAMAVMGLLWALAGLIALVDREYYTVRENSLFVVGSYTTWGWVHLVGGVVAAVAGVGILLAGGRAARIAGVVIAGLSAVVNLGYLPVTPVWALLVITLDVLVIYALTVHGWELEER